MRAAKMKMKCWTWIMCDEKCKKKSWKIKLKSLEAWKLQQLNIVSRVSTVYFVFAFVQQITDIQCISLG